MSEDQQPQLDGMPEIEKPGMIARINALAVNIMFPFVAKKDIRYYLMGINIRPLEDGVMLVATDGHRFIVIRDPMGFAERELIVSISKDGLKHAADPINTVDVISNGEVRISDKHALALFIQPGNSIIADGTFPRIENVVNFEGYTEGITGSINPVYFQDALEVSKKFGGVQFFTRDVDAPLLFVYTGLADLECFGGVMKLRDAFGQLPKWFPKRGIPTTLEEI